MLTINTIKIYNLIFIYTILIFSHNKEIPISKRLKVSVLPDWAKTWKLSIQCNKLNIKIYIII